MNVIALIPARGGSKGLKNKNIKKLNGKALINYTLEIALKTKLINNVFVSSDSEKILRISKNFNKNINIIKRPKKLAKDESTDLDVFKNFIEYYEKKYQKKIDLLVHLRVTTPLRKLKTISDTINLMIKNKNFSSLRCFVESDHSPYKMYLKKGSLALPFVKLKKEFHSKGRQYLPKTFNHVGYIDILRPNQTLNINSMTGKKIYFYLLNKNEYSIDIDNIADFKKTILNLKK